MTHTWMGCGWVAVGCVMAAACSRAPSEVRSTPPPRPATSTETKKTSPSAPPSGSDSTPLRSCLLDHPSPCLSEAPIDVRSSVLAWSNWLGRLGEDRASDHPNGVTECRWVVGLDDVLLCGSNAANTMNPPLLRASLFIEGGPRFKPGTVASRDDDAYAWALPRIGGFDLVRMQPDPPHLDLEGYYAALQQACARNATLCEDASERAMRELLQRAWSGRSRFVLVTFAHASTVPDEFAVSHELLHAQYFTTPTYREVVEAYWNELAAGDRKAIREALADKYDANDELLMRNEFQAYVLMAGADASQLAAFVGAHREPLLARLRAKGVIPIQPERRAISGVDATDSPGPG